MATDRAEAPTRLTLAELAERLPAPPAHAHSLYVGNDRGDEFELLGATIATERVLTDCRRLYAEAHLAYEALTKEQRADLVGFSPELLAYAVGCALELDAKRRAFDDAASATRQARASTDAELTAARKRAIARREQAFTVLERASAGHPAHRAALDASVGTAATEQDLAAGVQALGKLVTEWLDEPKTSVVRQRLALANVSVSFAKTLRETAAGLLAASEAASARGRGTPVSQQELDHDDGLNLFLLGQLVDAFDAAHDVDPAVPRLAPQATRRLLRPSRPRAKKPDAPPAPGA